MEAYTKQIEVSGLKPNTVYKITTEKSSFLGKYQGRNKNEQYHFLDTSNNRLVVLDPKIHITSIHALE
jgi:hypothetical protein